MKDEEDDKDEGDKPTELTSKLLRYSYCTATNQYQNAKPFNLQSDWEKSLIDRFFVRSF